MTNLAKAQELFFAALDAQNRNDLEGAERLYKEALIQAPDRPSILNNLAVVLQLQGKYPESRQCCERLLELNPADATAWMNLGNVQAGLQQVPEALASYGKSLAIDPGYVEALVNRAGALAMAGRHAEALADLDHALQIAPDHPEARLNRGNALIDLHRPEEALEDYRRCLEQDPGNAKILSSLGNALLEAGNPQESLAVCEQALTIDPAYAEACQNRGNALRDLKRYDEALQDYARAQNLAPSQPGAYWNESLCRLLLEDFEGGWRHYPQGWAAGQRGRQKPLFAQPEWNGAHVDGTLLAWGEQGIGDQILHASMLEQLQACARRLLVAVDPRLIPLFRRSFPGIGFVSLADLLRIDGFDVQVALGDIGAHLRKTRDSFPQDRGAFLSADRARAQELGKRLHADGNFVCGISWRSANPRLGRFKSLALPELAAMVSMPGVSCVDLQYGDTREERETLQKDFGLDLVHVGEIDNFRDIDGLAALIAACDMVVSVSNTTVHLAGALGKPTAILLPYAQGNLWYWHENRDTSLWYPSCRLLRQSRADDWSNVIADAAGMIRSAAGGR